MKYIYKIINYGQLLRTKFQVQLKKKKKNAGIE